MMQTLCTLRRWLRGLEPQVRTRLECSALARFQPWLERRALFRFQRQPLARGVAAGMFCGLIPGPLQIPGTLLVCAWLRGNIVAGGVATFYTNPLTTVPLYALAFYLGALVMPGEQTLPAWSSVAPAGNASKLSKGPSGSLLFVQCRLDQLSFGHRGQAIANAAARVPERYP